jgi:hypothetical protein
MNDGYKDNDARQVVFRYFRYRVTNTVGVYTCWYSGTILKIGQRKDIMARFKQAIGEMQGAAL